MIKILFIALLLLGSVYIGSHLHYDPGYVLITINHWTLESSLAFAILAILLLFFISHLLFGFIRWLLHLPFRWGRRLKQYRTQTAHAKTCQGFIEYSEGYWLRAKNNLIKALPESDAPLINYLIAARAAQELGDNQTRDNYLRQAAETIPDARIAVGLTQAQLQIESRQWEQALATLKHLQQQTPKHPYVLKLLTKLYVEKEDWFTLTSLLPLLKRNRIFEEKEYLPLEHLVYYQTLVGLIKQDENDKVDTFMNELPKSLASDSIFLAEFIQYLITKKEFLRAEKILHQLLKKHFDERFITLYGILPHHVAQIDFIETFISNYSCSALLFLALAHLSCQAQLWGKAKHYFENSIRIAPSKQAYYEYGKLLEKHFKDTVGALTAYKQGIMLDNIHRVQLNG